ncbi:MAG: hypothetical protein ACR2FG_15550 [Marmoricola sp.]
MLYPLHSPLRWFGAVLLLVTAAVHVPMVPEHLEEAPYIGALFIALAVVGVLLAVLLVLRDTPAVWAVSGIVALLAVVAFLVSRTMGLPQIGDDIGSWGEPLGFPALVAETLAALAALVALQHRTRNDRKVQP